MMRLVPLFITLAALSVNAPVHFAEQEAALTDTVGGVTFSYTVGSDDSAVITGANGLSGEFTVPANLGGHKVSAVAERAFFSNKDITSVTFSAPVSVGASAFAGCSSITSFNGMEKITALGKYAFTGCSALESVQLPPVSEIPEGLCASCTALKNVRFNSENSSVGKEAFFGCRELKIITVPYNISSVGDYAFGIVYDLRSDTYSSDKNVVIKCSPDSAAGKYAEKMNIDIFDPANDLLGDVNRDRLIDAGDASAVLAEYSVMSTGSEGTFGGYKLYSGDYDHNGVIDASDATDILVEYSRLSTIGTSVTTTAAPVTAATKTTTRAAVTTTSKTTTRAAATAAKTTASSVKTTAAKPAVTTVKSTVTTKSAASGSTGKTSAVTTAGTSQQTVKTTAAAVK